jgi:transposase-like protein
MNNLFYLTESFFPNDSDLNMGKTISLDRKKEFLPFIKGNFGRISQREIARKLGIGKNAVNRWLANFIYSKSNIFLERKCLEYQKMLEAKYGRK